MRHLVRLILFRHLRAAPGRTLLTLVGIVLGVATIFAVSIVNESVVASFRGTIDTIAGKTALTVGARTGVAEALLERVRKVPGVATAVPVIEDTVRDLGSGTELAVLGIDALADGEVRDYEMTAEDIEIEDDLAFLNDPHGVLVTEKFAARRGLAVEDTLQLKTLNGPAEFTVRGTLAPRGPATVFGGDLLLMDVYAAQIAFGRGRRFDRIDIVPEAGVAPGTLAARLERMLGGQADLSRPERRTQEAEQLLAGFQLGLSLAGVVAIFVGGFIVYNALAIAVAQRRREIGILRALSCTRAQVLTLFIAEGLILGAIGSAAGVFVGFLLARFVLGAVGDTVSSIYLSVKPEQLQVAPTDIVVAVALGVAASFMAALWPAWRASFVPPASAMRRQTAGDQGATGRGPVRVASFFAVVALGLAVLAHMREAHLLGYTVLSALTFSAAFLAPTLARGVGIAFRWCVRAFRQFGSPAILLGVVGFARNSERNAVAIAALGIALANVVNADAFVSSMRQTTATWFERSARADIMAFAGRKAHAKIDHPLPATLVDQIRTLPEVEFVNPYRTRRLAIEGKAFSLYSYDLERDRKYAEVPAVAGDWDEAMPAIAAGKAVGASQSFVRAFDVELGDEVTVNTPSGQRRFSIALVYVDYNSDLGALLTTRSIYTQLWGDDLADTLGIYLRPGSDVGAVRETIVRRWGGQYGLLALSNGQYKAQLLQAIDGSFAYMRVTELIAIIVAVLGIINTLLVTVIDRRTEIGVLKAIGADPAQVRAMLTVEGALIALSAAVFGVGLGAVFSSYILAEVLPMQIGWQLSWELSGATVLFTFVAAQGVALVASFWPAVVASKVDPIQALQYE